MAATVLYMSMSLDGFIAGPNEGPGNGLGDGGHRLHEWGADADHKKGVRGSLTGANGQVFDEFMATGAVVAGRGTFELAGGWGGDHHDGVPIFVLSRREPGIDTGQWPLVSYVTDVRTAMARARQAAGDKNVLVHGAGTAQLALAAGVLDELEIHLIPVLLGQGRRLFEGLGPQHVELERTRVLEGEDGVTHTHYVVDKEAQAAPSLAGGGLVVVPGMEDAMASTQSEVRALLENWSEAIRIKDIDRLMSLYSSDIVYFDLVPGLRYTGSAAVRGNFLRMFDGFKGPIGQEIRDLNILASGDIAVAYMLIRASGTLKDGREVGYWVRATVCCQRSDHRWLITHEHISLPVDPESRSAAMDLVP